MPPMIEPELGSFFPNASAPVIVRHLETSTLLRFPSEPRDLSAKGLSTYSEPLRDCARCGALFPRGGVEMECFCPAVRALAGTNWCITPARFSPRFEIPVPVSFPVMRRQVRQALHAQSARRSHLCPELGGAAGAYNRSREPC